MIDKNLDWKSHVKYISTKISKACGALAKLRNCVKIDVLKNVYHAGVFGAMLKNVFGAMLPRLF